MRLIPRLDIKGTNLIKGIQFEGLRVLGNPNKFALEYYENGADEIIFMDTVASLYGRNQLEMVLRDAAENIFVPIAVGGGINSVENAKILLNSGADKIAVNTAAILRPQLIKELSSELGSQSVILSIEAKKQSNGTWEAYSENGRQKTGLDVARWAESAENLGAGEILLTSVDRDGTEKGLDLELFDYVRSVTGLPIILSGGLGNLSQLALLRNHNSIDALGIGSSLHYQRLTLQTIRSRLLDLEFELREFHEK
jgi:cyclase